MSSQLFTRDGDEFLECRIAEICRDVREELLAIMSPKTLKGIALAGGYGRGEGGVFHTEAGDKPYNDVEFFAFAHGPRHILRKRWNRKIHALEIRLTEKYDIDVEIRLLGSGEIQRSNPSMFYYDLLKGHFWVLGDESLLENCQHHADPKNLPVSEATRLLMNRASGLLFAKRRLSQDSFDSKDADFVFRNLAKAQLAMGDSILASRGRYHWSCLERHKRLVSLQRNKEIVEHHWAGVEFKLHPHLPECSKEELQDCLEDVSDLLLDVFLQIESKRLGRFIPSADYYLKIRSQTSTPFNLRNRLINFRDSGPAGLLDDSHPRERLLDLLCSQLWCREENQPASCRPENWVGLWQRHG